MKNTPPIQYRIVPRDPHAHLFEVACTIADPAPDGQHFTLPAWIPGSYLIRDFARHVTAVQARSGRKSVAIEKIDKDTWRAAPCDGPLTVTIEVYAWDFSVRGAHLDATHAFFNGTSVFLRAIGAQSRACEVEILPPPGARYRQWRVATTLARKDAPAYGFGTYKAADYDELIDHPVEMGTFTLATFKAGGVPHDIAVTGRHDADMERLCADLARVCGWHIDLFGRPAPMKRYLFLVTALGDAYGGLEHRASTALLCSREDLPRKGVKEVTDAYRTFLGLCSHEYFHTWNVKRIKPSAFTPYDLQRENFTTLLWAFEGVTSYYDDLALVRSGVIAAPDYLEILGRSITSLLRTGGRLKQSVCEASFDAWIKYYRQDENSPNALVSYYLKGSLIALCLDLTVRESTHGRKSLDDIMRALWQRHGMTGEGVSEDGWERLAEEVTDVPLRGFFQRALRSTEELPLKQALAGVGIELQLRQAESPADRGGRPGGKRAAPRVSLGARTGEDGAGVKLTHVLDGGSAQRAGLAAGDVLVALDGLRVSQRTLDKQLQRLGPDQRVRAHAFRRDELIECELRMQAAAADTCYLSVSTDVAARRRRERWLGTGDK